MGYSFDDLRQAIRSTGVVRGEAVRELHDALRKADPIGRKEADLLFELHAEVSATEGDRSWQTLFVDALTGHVLGGSSRPGVLRDEDAVYLIAKLGEASPLGEVEIELLVNVCACAERVPDRFLDYVFSALRRAVEEDGQIAEARVGQIRRVVYGGGDAGREGIDRRTGNFLFDLNDAMTGRPNHPAWTEFFVEAISGHVLDDDRSPEEVDASEADWLVQRMEADQQYDDTEMALLAKIKHAIRHNEVWGGIRSDDLQASTSGVVASLYSRACEGGKGGDLYYFSLSASDMLTRIAVADVSGHGPTVTDVSQWIYDSLAARMNSAEGNEVLADLNRLAAERGYKALTTAVVVTFYRPDSHLYFAYAGHPPAYVRRRSDDRWRPVTLVEGDDPANLPLGVDPDVRYDQQRIPLARGDRLFLYTDGVVEAPDADGQILGASRLAAVLDAGSAGTPRDVKDAVLAAIHEHTGGSMTHDDVTFMVVEVL